MIDRGRNLVSTAETNGTRYAVPRGSLGSILGDGIGRDGDRQADRPRLGLQDDRTFHGWSPGTEKPPGKRR